MSWHQIWLTAITRPSQATYKEIAKSMPKGIRVPIFWVFMSSWIGLGLTYNAYRIAQNQYDSRFVICSALFGILGVLGVGLYSLVTQSIAKFLGGSGAYSQMFWMLAAVTSPLIILSGVVGAFGNLMPFLIYVTYLIWVYQVILFTLITQAVNDFNLEKAIIANIPLIAIEILSVIS